MPVTDIILWQNVPTGARVDVSVEPVNQPVVSDGEHTFGATTLEQAGDDTLRPGPHSFRQFKKPGSHTVDVRTANLAPQSIDVTVTATLFDSEGTILTGPEQRPRAVPSNDHHLVMIAVKVVGAAAPADEAAAPAIRALAVKRLTPPRKKAAKKQAIMKKSAKKTAPRKATTRKTKRPKGGK